MGHGCMNYGGFGVKGLGGIGWVWGVDRKDEAVDFNPVPTLAKVAVPADSYSTILLFPVWLVTKAASLRHRAVRRGPE